MATLYAASDFTPATVHAVDEKHPETSVETIVAESSDAEVNEEEWKYPYPTDFKLDNYPIDQQPRQLTV